MAFVVGPFEVVDGGKAGQPGRRCASSCRGAAAPSPRYAAEATPRVVAALEDYFGMPYPYDKLDVAVVPRYWGTMEHPGIVAIGQPLTLIKPGEETHPAQAVYANIARARARPLLVRRLRDLAWWNDTWLNEALGHWIDGKITDGLEPSWRMPLGRMPAIQGAMEADTLATAQKIRLPVESAQAIQNAFSARSPTPRARGPAMFESYAGRRDLPEGHPRLHARARLGGDDARGFPGVAAAEPGRPEVAARC